MPHSPNPSFFFPSLPSLQILSRSAPFSPSLFLPSFLRFSSLPDFIARTSRPAPTAQQPCSQIACLAGRTSVVSVRSLQVSELVLCKERIRKTEAKRKELAAEGLTVAALQLPWSRSSFLFFSLPFFSPFFLGCPPLSLPLASPHGARHCSVLRGSRRGRKCPGKRGRGDDGINIETAIGRHPLAIDVRCPGYLHGNAGGIVDSHFSSKWRVDHRSDPCCGLQCCDKIVICADV